ncbi:MAG TPA: hypothetical protein VHA52_01105 [Candidatus Babeliaceae bacterium]|nr:hypothetical protein [Candidatus Babeliaceae bacterium]
MIPIIQTLDINQDGFVSDFKNSKLIWGGFDTSVISISSSNVKISNLDLKVREKHSKPIVVIGDKTKMINTIIFDSVNISSSSDLFSITNVKNILFSNCVFTTKDLRSNIFVLSNVYSISIINCRLSGGDSVIVNQDTVSGYLTRSKVYNANYLFYFDGESSTRWKVSKCHFNNIENMTGGKFDKDKNQFVTDSNQFHSSNSENLTNGLNQYNDNFVISRDIFGDIGSIFGGGGSGSGSGGGTGGIGLGIFSKSFSITQILIFIAVAFVILVIIIVLIVFIVRIAKGRS